MGSLTVVEPEIEECGCPTLAAYRAGQLPARWCALAAFLVAELGLDVQTAQHWAAVWLISEAELDESSLRPDTSECDRVLSLWLQNQPTVADAMSGISGIDAATLTASLEVLWLAAELPERLSIWEPPRTAVPAPTQALTATRMHESETRIDDEIRAVWVPASTASRMPVLGTPFASLVRHHIATLAQPLPDATPGITWCLAANGIFKRGVDRALDALIVVESYSTPPMPGLTPLLPHVRWRDWATRIPAWLLTALLANARQAMSAGTIVQPIEKQYFFVWRDRDLRLVAPHGQEATTGRVRYTMPMCESILLDVHSHHAMPAFFSSTDDADDLGLSISAVIGRIFTAPEIAVRINVYGHHLPIPARLIFDDLGPFRDVYEGGATRADLSN